MDDELLDIEEYYDFNLLDLLENEDIIYLADKSEYELNNDPKCIKIINKK